MSRRRETVKPYFAGVVIEGVPGGGTPEQAAQLITERLVRHVARTVQAQELVLPVREEEAAD
ncbi:hypothetical protein [Deinococcus xianganensis]|uniref:Uncharacterized protein n=1 Tax=Deinococcus xianganensis TaxID=1507289 RepID=A0A6I4YF87_9DEIO|nr:hypothetical protein [Deinococcus xianganensis]MXV18626.1 hypothetical protein [Deinococcus xianganensis]